MYVCMYVCSLAVLAEAVDCALTTAVMEHFFHRVAGPAPFPTDHEHLERATFKAAAAARALQLGVPWPPVALPAPPGRPHRAEVFERALVVALERIASGTDPDRELPAVPPGFWKPGMAVDAADPAAQPEPTELTEPTEPTKSRTTWRAKMMRFRCQARTRWSLSASSLSWRW